MSLCRGHYDEHLEEQRLQSEAVYLLHHGTLNDRSIQHQELAEEFRKLQVWWHRACDAVNFEREDPILRNEAKYAINWCVSLAVVIIREEQAFRGGDTRPNTWDPTRNWVWERFKNLEEGLMSNGVIRPPNK